MNWSYPLPFAIRLSGVLQTADGFNTATPPAPLLTQNPDNHDGLYSYNVTRTILPSLVQTGVAVFLDEPGANIMPRVTQVDFAVSKTLQLRRVRVTPQIDVFNALNANTLLTRRTAFGPTMGYPTTILSGRLVRFQARFSFNGGVVQGDEATTARLRISPCRLTYFRRCRRGRRLGAISKRRQCS